MSPRYWDDQGQDYDDGRQGTGSALFTEAEVDLMNEMRSLWEQHVAWTRMTIISIASNSPDQEAVTRRLLRNATDMGNALRPLYGRTAATEFTRLMREHLVLAAQLVEAAKAGDNKAAARTERLWYRNADEIAAFLSTINPCLEESALREMLHEHLELVKAQATARLAGRYARDIAIYDRGEAQALTMADAISNGIIAQFPNIFSREEE